MKADRKYSSGLRLGFIKLGFAGRVAIYCAACVLALSFLCAGYTYRRYCWQAEERFERAADIVSQMTANIWGQEEGRHREEVLRSYYQFESKRGQIDHIAFLFGSQIVVAHSRDWEGMDPNFVFGESFKEDFPTSRREGELSIRMNKDLDRLEGLVYFLSSHPEIPVSLYLSRSAAAIRMEAWDRFLSILRIGMVLAVGAGILIYAYLQSVMVTPLKKLREHVAKEGLDKELIESDLGELQQLAGALETATQRLLQSEEAKQAELRIELHKVDEESAVQTELLRIMVTDLRASMSAVLAHAELLMAGDPRPADRFNYIRAIQQDARRISRLVHELQDLLPTISSLRAKRKRTPLPIKQLRKVIEQLHEAKPTLLHLHSPDSQRIKYDTAGQKLDSEPNSLETQYDEPPVKRRLGGSVLLVGRKDEPAEALIKELHDVDIHAVWVFDIWAAIKELSDGEHDLVIVNLSKRDRATMDLIRQVHQHHPDGPLVALLPESARGDGSKYVDLGCSDYIYAPISRQGVLAVIGKFLPFEPIAPLSPEPAE